MSGGGEVILFPRERDDTIEPPAEVKPKDWMGCQHRAAPTLDLEAHQMVCGECGQVLDCFDWIVSYTRRWSQENSLYKQAQQQRAAAEEQLRVVERAEKNAKARVRKQGVNLTTAEARIAYEQLRALGMALQDAIGDRDKAIARARLCGFKQEDAQRAIEALRAQLDLNEIASGVA